MSPVSKILVFLVALALSTSLGYLKGKKDAEAEFQGRILAYIEAGQKLDDARRRVAQERDELAARLEEEAYADPVIVERCLSPDRLRRLNSLR